MSQLLNVISALAQAGNAMARSRGSISAAVFGRLGTLIKYDVAPDVPNLRALADRAILEATNFRKLQAVSGRNAPTIANTMLPLEFKTPEDFKYVVTYDYIDQNGNLQKSGYSIFSNERLTKNAIIAQVEEELAQSVGLGLRSGFTELPEFRDVRLAGAYYNERGA